MSTFRQSIRSLSQVTPAGPCHLLIRFGLHVTTPYCCSPAPAVAGLEELARIDGQFDAYRKTLFSPQSSQTDRELQTKQFNEKLDQSLNQFLRLLSPYIMLTPAHQTFEYLIRLYKLVFTSISYVGASSCLCSPWLWEFSYSFQACAGSSSIMWKK